MTLRLFLAVLVAMSLFAGCEVDDPTGTCFWQYNNGETWGFGCQKGVGDDYACQDLAAEGYGLAAVVNWEWSEACAEVGCTGTCGPDWWRLY